MAKSKKTKKQERKRKSRTLILLLFLTIIMFGTSTYAWFTANKVVTINSIDVNVQASDGIQISTDGENWKSVIMNSDITTGAYSGNKNQLPQTITNVSTDGAVDQTAGTLKMYGATIDNDATTGDYNIVTTKETESAGTLGKFVAFDIFLRVDQARPVYLTTSSSVLDTNPSQTGDKGLKNAARVAFVTLGNTPATSDVSTIIGLNNPASTAIIWEPNTDQHTAMATTVAAEYGVDISGSVTQYRGINQEIAQAQDLKKIVASSTTYTTAMSPAIQTTYSYSTYQVVFNPLSAGVTKVRVYLWIEGQDIDCENNATGSSIQYNIQLSTESSASGSSSSSSNG